MNESGRTLITGASAGIGKEIARTFAREGHDLVLVARRQPELETLAQELTSKYEVDVAIQVSDLAKDGAADELFEAVSDYPIEILVNNAGVMTNGGFARMDSQTIHNMIRLNVLNLTHLCHRFITPMYERGEGRIVNVASIAAFQAVPYLSVYAATKAFVLSLTEGLSIEAKNKGVTVTAVCPGFTDTDMLRGSVPGSSDGGIPSVAVLSPKKVAEDVYAATLAGDVIKVPGMGYALTMATTRLMPRWLLREVSAFALNFGKK